MLNELQKLELEVLKYFDDFCKKNKLTYYLAGGTLIGAVRHNGFIPWDDDIDVFMKRKDYMRLIKLWDNKNEGRYKLLSIYENTEYYYPFVKVVDSFYKVCEGTSKQVDNLGPWIDVFPLDYYSSSIKYNKLDLDFKKYCLSSSTRFEIGESKGNPFRILIKYIAFLLYHKKNPQKYAKEIDLKSSLLLNETEYVFVGCSPNRKKDVFESKWYKEIVYIPFEGYNFPCPKEYDAVLTSRYGEYMKLPPENERIGHHFIEIEKVYKTVLTYGTFDLFHYGHYNLLKRAFDLFPNGCRLIVGVSSDKMCLEKGKAPFLSQEKRCEIVSSLKFVDDVIIEENMHQKVEDAKKYNANVFLLGSDYKEIFPKMEEYKQLIDMGCEIVFLERTPNISTTELKKKEIEQAKLDKMQDTIHNLTK